MLPDNTRKLKALMMIAMLAVAEGHRVEMNMHAFGDSSSSGSHGTGSREGPPTPGAVGAPMGGAPLGGGLNLDMMMKDPDFHKQLEAMAGHMDKFKDKMMANPGVMKKAQKLGKGMLELPAFPTYEDFVKNNKNANIPEQMEAMIADPAFQKAAQAFAEEMQRSVVADTDVQEHMDSLTADSIQSAQEQSATVSEKMIETMADPNFQQQADGVSRLLNSLMEDPDLQKEAESIAAYVEQVKNTAGADHDIAQDISGMVDAVIANTKFKDKAFDVVLEMLSSDLKEDSDSTEWLQDVDLDELASAVENPSPELLEAIEAVRRAKAKQPSLLEVNQTRGQESAVPTRQLLFALTGLVSPGLAYNFGPMTRPTGRAPAIGMTAPGARHQPHLGGLSGGVSLPGRGPRPWRRIAELAAKDRGPRMAMGMDDFEAPTASGKDPARMFQSAAAPTAGALTSAKGIRSMMPSLVKALPGRGKGAVMAATADGNKKGGVDVALLLCFSLWYLGNYYYNISNKIALTAAGGAAGFPMTIATLQLGVGVLYALFMWIAPDARKRPDMTFKDYVATLPVGAMSAGAHAASVFALGAGSVSFAQIVKASEPAFAAVIGTLAYSAKLSKAKWLSLIPVIGGVCLASLGELNFAVGALITASIANVFAAIKGNENAKLMKTEGLSDRIGSVGNQFAITTINAFLFTLPVMLLTEGARLGQFLTLMKTSPLLLSNLVSSGLWFYLYNELATLTIKKTDAVTQSVANTAKRVIVIIVVALVMKESLTPLKLIGSGIGIGGVFLYSIIDKLVDARKARKAAKAGLQADTIAPADETSMAALEQDN